MSRKPGIGTSWYKKYHSDVYPHGYCIIRDGIKTPPPKYYNNKYELTNPIEYGILKQEREKAAQLMAADNTQTRLATKERLKKCQTKILLRELE